MIQSGISRLRRDRSLWLSDECLFIGLGVSLSALYLIALNAFSTLFIIGLILSALITALVFIRSNVNVIGYAIAVAVTFWISGTKLICWDTASFELPSFFDWVNGLRGAYWDYSKLPSMFFGLAYTLGRDAYRLVYALQAILLVIGLSRMTSERRSPLYFGALTFILLNLFPQLFDHGKGDLLALDFSLIALSFAPLRSMKKAESHQKGRHWAIFLLFGSLAIAAKLSAALAMLPLGLMALVSGGLLEVYRHNKRLITLVLALTCGNFSVNIYNLIHFGSILDARNAATGSALSLIHHLLRLISDAMTYPPNLYAGVILGTGLLALEAITSVGANRELRIRNGILLFTLLATPLVFLFEFRESTNLRLIAFPLLSIWAMNIRGPSGNPTA